ncbi:serine hydrolase [Streptomyces sp. NBC_01716]|uniref:serine hydrolase domain-containing protein n=1 Tax=Streptomyces sp. NBC_01716 TaxID=2975917 RepID=UPI003FCC9B49
MVLDDALAQIPDAHRHGTLVRADSAGSAKAFLTHIRTLREHGLNLRFSVGYAVTEPVRRAIRSLPEALWHPALDQNGTLRNGAEAADVTGMVDLAGYPAGTRNTVRRERPHPGAQLSLFDHDEGLRHQVFLTDTPPGFAHLYSCVGYVALGRLLEELDDRPLDTLIRTRVLDPLGAATATFRPSTISATVATETQLHRGPVRGQVHDELAHAIGRPVGNAGMFATAEDVLALGSMVLNGGAGRARRVLSAESVKLLSEPFIDADNYHQAIGFRVGDDLTMGRIQGIGHTGFTGTSLVIAPHSGGTAVLLTNRVHPTRFDADITALRRSFAERLEQPVAD